MPQKTCAMNIYSHSNLIIPYSIQTASFITNMHQNTTKMRYDHATHDKMITGALTQRKAA